MKYKQLTSEERYMISAYRKGGLSVSQMAKEMNRHPSTIYREIRRHFRQNTYRHEYAHTRAITRRSVARRGLKINPDDRFVIKKLLRHNWSPDALPHLKSHFVKVLASWEM